MTRLLTTWEKDPTSVPVGPLGIIAMAGCEEIGEKINQWLLKWHSLQELQDEEYYTSPGLNRDTFLVKAYCPRFGTGEGKAVLRESVRGMDLYILVDVCAHNVHYNMYGQEVPMSPDDHFQDLKRIIAAATGKAHRINVIMPFIYEGRQHKRTKRESLDCALALQELMNMGVSNFITFDAHDPRVMNAIPLGGFDNFMPTYQFLKALLRSVPDLTIDNDHLMIISPDEGSMSRAIYLANILGVDIGMYYKRLDYSKRINGRHPIAAYEFLGPNLKGKDMILIDDMISSGESMIDTARELKKRKANRIFVVSTFGLFTNGFASFDKAYEEGLIYRVVTTNLIYQSPELLSKEYYISCDMSKYIAYLIDTLNHDCSISDLLSPYDRIKKCVQKYNDEQAAAKNK